MWYERLDRSRTGSRPSTRMLPLFGRKMPVIILMVVDLPAPLGPMKATISPGGTTKSID